MNKRLTSAIQLLQVLKPTRKILGVAIFKEKIGIAVSDPYLSHATPITTISNSQRVHDKIFEVIKVAKTECADALIVGLPVAGKSGDEIRRDEFVQLLLAEPSSPVISVSDLAPATEAYIIEEYKKNILWDSLQLESHDLNSEDSSSVHAGVSLQMWLDKHCGGWQNTFG
jgi:RNase H-fold protein (predicted Holliday junction resolvase)